MINFIFGNSGTGKTTHVLNMLRQDAEVGIPSILIVPEQQAVQAERLTLEKLPPSAQLTLEVLNFSRLYNRVCREYGGLCYSYITTPLKHLMMWKTLRELSPLLNEYSSNAKNDGAFASTALSTVTEMKYASVTPDMLEEAADRCADNESLSKRLKDIALIYGAYDLAVNEQYSDSADDLSKLCDILDEHDFFKGKNVYIDSFVSFTAIEHRVIEKIFKGAENVCVTVPLPTKSYSDVSTAGVERSVKALIKSANKWGGYTDTILNFDKSDVHPSLRYLSENIWNLSKSPVSSELPSADGHIVMEICDNSYSEAEATASHILELLRKGERCRDIVIIMRDAEKYRGIIDPALEKAGIPFFFSEKTDICALAPIKYILTAIRIRQYNWRKNDVIAHIKTGLCDFSPRSADLFEEYINTWNISGARFTGDAWTMNPDGFTDRISDRGKVILSTANSIKQRLCAPLEELFVMLDSAESVADMCRAIYVYVEKAALREKTLELAKKELDFGNKKAASELASSYDIILKTLADIGTALNDVAASIDDFYDILKTVFEQTDIGTIPTSIDEVTIGSASKLRSSNPKYVFILGMCEGEFPANVDDNGLLNDNDRAILSDMDIELGADGSTRSSDELLYVKNSFAAPTERLYLMTSVADLKGSLRTPSLPFRRVEKMFSDVKPHRFCGNDLSYLCGSAQSAAAHLRNIDDETERKAATLAVAEHLPLVTKLSDKPVNQAECKIDPQIVKDIVGDKIYISPSSLEKYVKCPFNYYASYMLSLRETVKGSFKSTDFGNFVHYVMENIISFSIPSNEDQAIPTKEQINEEILRIVAKYIRTIAPDDALKTKRMEHLYKKLCRLSMLIVDNLVSEFSDSDFRPAFFELRINGEDGNPAPLEIPLSNGAKILLKGFIDRVDLWKDGEKIYVRIVDYKTGSKQFELSDLDYGLNTQMLLYLFTVCSNPGTKFRTSAGLDGDSLPVPAGVVYLSSAIPKEKLDDFSVSEEDVLLSAEQKFSRSGIILDDENIINAISHSGSRELLMGISQKDGKYTGKALVSSEKFDELYAQIKDTLTDIGERIYKGIADSKPIDNASYDPCKYCAVKPMCRRNDF